MYIRNIINSINELKENQELLIFFRSGRQSKICFGDKYQNSSADLKIIRTINENKKCKTNNRTSCLIVRALSDRNPTVWLMQKRNLFPYVTKKSKGGVV